MKKEVTMLGIAEIVKIFLTWLMSLAEKLKMESLVDSLSNAIKELD